MGSLLWYILGIRSQYQEDKEYLKVLLSQQIFSENLTSQVGLDHNSTTVNSTTYYRSG